MKCLITYRRWLYLAIVLASMFFGNTISSASMIAISSDGTKLYHADNSGTEAKTVSVWNLDAMRLKDTLIYDEYGGDNSWFDGRIACIAVSPDGKRILIADESSSSGLPSLWNTENGMRLEDLYRDGITVKHGFTIESTAFSSDGKFAASCGRKEEKMVYDKQSSWKRENGLLTVPVKDWLEFVDKCVILWDLQNPKQHRYLIAHKDDVSIVVFSPNSELLLTGSNDGTAKLWSIPAGKVVETIGSQPEGVVAAAFSLDSKRIILGRGDGTIAMWDRDTASIIWQTERNTVKSESKEIHSIALSGDATLLLTGHTNGEAFLWDASRGAYIRTISQLPGSASVVFLPGKTHAVIGSGNGGLELWDLNSNKRMSLKKKGQEWIFYTSDGYFMASRRGGQLVSLVKELDVYGIDQFAAKFNRPDIIMESFGLGSKKIISHFHKQHLKRLHRFGFTEEQLKGDLHVPEALIKNIKQSGKFVELTFDLEDSKYNLKKYNIYINDVPIFGAYGKEIAGKSVSKTERIELTQGKNKIEVTCINEAGAESHRALASADYNEKVKGDLYYIGFGVSKYKDSSLNLEYAAKDAKDLADTFSGLEGTQFKDVHIKTYLDEQVTVDNIKKAKDFLANATVDDTFVLFISGHGVHDKNEEATYYYITHDADIKKLSKTSADFELIENILQGIAPRNKLFLMDTCESGETEEDSQVKYFAMANKKGFRPRTTRAIGVERKDNKKRAYLYNKDRFIYNDLLRRSGTIVFSSSKGGEFSYESDDLKNGFFTAAIINALRTKKADINNDTYVSTDELRDYVSETVSKQTEYMQHPTVDRDNIYQKFAFPIVGN